MKVLKVIILAAVLGPLIAVTTTLLFWMGRPSKEQPRDLVVDDDLLADDPGVDVDLFKGEGDDVR